MKNTITKLLAVITLTLFLGGCAEEMVYPSTNDHESGGTESSNPPD